MLEGDLTVGEEYDALDKFETSEISVEFKSVREVVRYQVERLSLAMFD